MFIVKSYRSVIMAILFFVTISFFLAATVLAHGDGATYEEEKDGYFVDIGYSSPQPVVGESIRFDFTTYPTAQSAQGEEIFTDVWVRLAQDRDLFFAGGIDKPEFGTTGFTYSFPKPGVYELTSRFQKDGNSVVEVSFPIEVFPAPDEAKSPISLNLILAFCLGILLGATAGYLGFKKFAK